MQKKYLHLGQKLLYLDIFGLKFEKVIVIFRPGQIARLIPIGRARARKISESCRFFALALFSLQKEEKY